MTDINYINTIPLGKINRWGDTKASSIQPISFPGKDASKTEGVDTLGIIAYYNFSGKWTGEYNTLQSYIASIKSILDGAQIAAVSLQSPFVNAEDSGTNRVGSVGKNTSTSSLKLIDSNATFSIDGVQAGDKVKNLISGEVSTVSSVDSYQQLTLTDNIFTSSDTPYAVTATINVKVLSFAIRWELPGLAIAYYDLSVMQVV